VRQQQHEMYDGAAEGLVIGGIIGNESSTAYFEAGEHIRTSKAFYTEVFRRAWEAVGRLVDAGSAPSYDALVVEMTRVGDLPANQAGSMMARLERMQICSVSQVPLYARTVADYHARRGATQVLAESLDAIRKPGERPEDSVSRIIARLEGVIEAPSHKILPFVDHVKGLARELIERNKGTYDGPEPVSTGLPALDARIGGGYLPGQLIGLGGNSGMGKSTVARWLSLRAAMPRVLGGGGQGVYSATTEMHASEVTCAMMGTHVGASMQQVREGALTQHQFSKALAFANACKSVRLYIDDDGSLSVTRAISRIRRIHAREGLSIAFIDHFNRLDFDLCPPVGQRGWSRSDEPKAEAARRFKRLAAELGITIVMACQATQECFNEKRPPTHQDTRGTKVLGQECDVFLGVFRARYWYQEGVTQAPKGYDGQWPPREDRLDIYVGAKRGCRPGRVTCYADMASGTLAPLGGRDE